MASGAYNPVARRFGVDSGEVPEEVKSAVLDTMLTSQGVAARAFELLPNNYWRPVTENIIYLGIPDMCRRGAAGTYAGNLRRSQRLPKMTQNYMGGTES